jgi:hypothetical protein
MNPQPQPITLIVISERGKARRSSPRDAPGRLRGLKKSVLGDGEFVFALAIIVTWVVTGPFL